jgi:SAM-dependent methyltransferase
MRLFARKVTPPPDARAVWPIDLDQDPTLRKSFDLERTKWGEVPYTWSHRIHSAELLEGTDAKILEFWTTAHLGATTGKAFSMNGWYQQLYVDVFRGKKLLDVGCGLGRSSVFFASHGARVTFLDVVESNVKFVQRVCDAKRLTDVRFCYMEDLHSLSALPFDYDFIYCAGSFHHAPMEVARMEAQVLLLHLPVDGRWIQLSYPESRWAREGRQAFDRWGVGTDGGAPWAEWHDLPKLTQILAPATFEVILNFEFHNSDFNWFDLVRRA